MLESETPFREVQNFGKQLLKQPGLFPNLTRLKGNPNNLSNRLFKGVLPADVLCRPPANFSETEEKKNNLSVSRSGLIFILHAQPNGSSAHDGFSNFMLRVAAGSTVNTLGISEKINLVVGRYRHEIELVFCDGYFEEALQTLLAATNDAMTSCQYKIDRI